MQTVVIGKNQAGQRLDKFLHKYLPEAGNSFLYKMLRKKNITLNGKKAQGQEILSEGDVVESFFSEETFAKFAGRANGEKFGKRLNLQNLQEETQQGIQNLQHSRYSQYLNAYKNLKNIDILYEDENIIILNKPAGILTQKAAPQDLSLNEWLVGYLLASGGILEEELETFHPSVCNRLDRNTSGIVLCGKSLAGLQNLSRIIKDRSLRKFYRTVCVGEITEDMVLEGSLVKDRKTNKVIVKNMVNKALDMSNTDMPTGDISKYGRKCEYIRTAFHPLTCQNGFTYLEVELFTGKSHQIRAQLASMGHPIIGDSKYGDRQKNQYFFTKHGLKHHLLHAHHVIFPKADDREGNEDLQNPEQNAVLRRLYGREFSAPCPVIFEMLEKAHFQ